MPRIYQRTARKDYPSQGIKKGDKYFTWHPKGIGWQRQLTPPREEQLTQSEFRLFCIEKKSEIENLNDCYSHDDLQSALDLIVSEIREKADEEDEKWNNLPENFQQADIGQLLEERRDALNNWADELESVSIDEDEDLETIVDELSGIEISIF